MRNFDTFGMSQSLTMTTQKMILRLALILTLVCCHFVDDEDIEVNPECP